MVATLKLSAHGKLTTDGPMELGGSVTKSHIGHINDEKPMKVVFHAAFLSTARTTE